jgi:hypothetical protein
LYHTTWNHFPADFHFKRLFVATFGATKLDKVTFMKDKFLVHYSSVCVNNARNSEENTRTQHCKVFWLILISNYFEFKILKNLGHRYRMYYGRDSCILRYWVIFEVFTVVSVKTVLVLIWTPCRLVEIYHLFLCNVKLEVVISQSLWWKQS